MFEGRSVLAVVPARGGSKGIRLKNLRKVDGISLVARTANVVMQLEYVDRAVVSTDNDEIADAARQAGLDVPFYRPDELSGDYVSDWEVLVHALGALEDVDKRRYDIVVMLQPTSPLRKPDHVTQAVAKLVSGGYDAVWTVSETDSKHHPLKQLCVDVNSRLEYYDSRGGEIIARQELEAVYHRNGVAYAMTRDCIAHHRSIKGEKTAALVIDDPIVNVDTEWDLLLAEFVLSKQPSAK